MASRITRLGIPDRYDLTVKKSWLDAETNSQSEIEAIYNMDKTTAHYVKGSGISGFGYWVQKELGGKLSQG